MQRARHGHLATAGVTAREAEILAAIGRRLTNKEIADHLFISVRTVESHVSSLMRKLGLTSRSGLIELALRLPGERTLPEPTTTFVGRDDELSEVARRLADGPLVCLVGPAGCGKTRLAIEAARRWHADVRLMELSGAAPGDVSSLVADVLGGGYEASDLVAATRVALAGAEVLLVADGCEYVADGAARVLALLVRSVPGLHVLATSQVALGIDGERVMPVGPLAVPEAGTPQDIQARAAGRLFVDRALAASPSFSLDEASAPHVAAICRRLDGLPLASNWRRPGSQASTSGNSPRACGTGRRYYSTKREPTGIGRFTRLSPGHGSCSTTPAVACFAALPCCQANSPWRSQKPSPLPPPPQIRAEF